LRDACAEFGGAIVHVRHLSLRIRDEGDPEKEIEGRLRVSYERAWNAYVKLQLLSHSEETQNEARYAIRHAWALWQEMVNGIDPRADEYPGESPGARLNEALRRFYVNARGELGIEHPEAVSPERLDWDLHPGVVRQRRSPPRADDVTNP
jgi:hypothetical protein